MAFLSFNYYVAPFYKVNGQQGNEGYMRIRDARTIAKRMADNPDISHVAIVIFDVVASKGTGPIGPIPETLEVWTMRDEVLIQLRGLDVTGVAFDPLTGE